MPRLSLRLRLALLVAGTTLPAILFAAGVVYVNYARERDAAFDRVLDTVRRMRIALDAEMQGVVTALDVLANSNAMRRGDLDGFRTIADLYLRRYGEASAISVAERDGTQIFNSRLTPGEPLPPRRNVESVEAVFATGKPYFSNLFVGSVSRQRLITVSVPVMREGKVVLELSFNPPLESFQHILTAQGPSEWTASFFDRSGTNFARVPNPAETIGQKASPTLLPALLDPALDHAKLRTTSLEGVPLLTAFSRSPITGWTVAAGTPVETLTAPLWRALGYTAAIGFALMTIGLMFAIGMAQRIARGEAMLGLMVNELNHRVKNTLASVQSIAAQTFRNVTDPAEATQKFNARLIALGGAHDVLSEEKWRDAELREIVQNALDPFTAKDSARVHLSGPNVRLAPRSALMTGMVMHELATNAAKYGALSVPGGRIEVAWDFLPGSGGGEVEILWQERGGPPVSEPSRKGFGSRLIEEGFRGQLGGEATIEFRGGGLVCRLRCAAGA